MPRKPASKRTIRLLLIDDHAVVRLGFVAVTQW